MKIGQADFFDDINYKNSSKVCIKLLSFFSLHRQHIPFFLNYQSLSYPSLSSKSIIKCFKNHFQERHNNANRRANCDRIRSMHLELNEL